MGEVEKRTQPAMHQNRRYHAEKNTYCGWVIPRKHESRRKHQSAPWTYCSGKHGETQKRTQPRNGQKGAHYVDKKTLMADSPPREDSKNASEAAAKSAKPGSGPAGPRTPPDHQAPSLHVPQAKKERCSIPTATKVRQSQRPSKDRAPVREQSEPSVESSKIAHTTLKKRHLSQLGCPAKKT